MGNGRALALVPERAPSERPPRRAELLAGLAFLDGSRDPHWGAHGLRDWFHHHLVETGCMMPPIVVTEHAAGTVALYGSNAHGVASQANLPKILLAARIRVVSAMRGLVASPTDDRFLTAAIFTGRVRRMRIDGETRWVLRPEPTATLSGIVLGLFATDVLTHRELYDRSLCVCETCDRLTFKEGTAHRMTCPDHVPSTSGFTRKVTPPPQDT